MKERNYRIRLAGTSENIPGKYRHRVTETVYSAAETFKLFLGFKKFATLVKVTLQLTVSKSVCLDIESRLVLMTRCGFLAVGRPL
jgi:hypothetical protein